MHAACRFVPLCLEGHQAAVGGDRRILAVSTGRRIATRRPRDQDRLSVLQVPHIGLVIARPDRAWKIARVRLEGDEAPVVGERGVVAVVVAGGTAVAATDEL